jgi:hypothetical protein
MNSQESRLEFFLAGIILGSVVFIFVYSVVTNLP